MDYLDFGSSDSEPEDDAAMICAMDSDDEERQENKRILEMFNLEDAPSKTQRKIQDFEAEMEAELDRRALEIESQGGMEHQKSLSRSSSTASLNKSPRASPVPGTSRPQPRSCIKRTTSNSSSSSGVKRSKSVKFESTGTDPDTATISQEASSSTKIEDKKAKEMYDELYFDSDEDVGEDDTAKEHRETKRRFMTNDELFYDPSSDAKDQEWIDKQRRKSYGESNNASSTSKKANLKSESTVSNSEATKNAPSSINLPSTDAVLNCAACFTTVCHDCQRHELYVGQYRAMFVVNCVINQQETLTVPEKVPKKFRKRQKAKALGSGESSGMPQFTPNSSSDVFHPVNCRICKTQVAMYDSDEVYHFFNVLASQP